MENLSLGNSKIIHGIKVKKLPIGKYLELTKKVNDLGKEVFENGFGNKSFEEILESIINLDKDEIINLIKDIFNIAPEVFINFIVDILDVDREKLVNNEEIGLYELIEILEAFAQVNNLGKLVLKTKQIINLIPMKTQNTGYKS